VRPEVRRRYAEGTSLNLVLLIGNSNEIPEQTIGTMKWVHIEKMRLVRE